MLVGPQSAGATVMMWEGESTPSVGQNTLLREAAIQAAISALFLLLVALSSASSQSFHLLSDQDLKMLQCVFLVQKMPILWRQE